ncbi:hypothetical protein BKA70DRAFT_1442642 [Coprinopsis sp. MPI-PUGE-AT-0042]|nr:hypothetical protein BKA70DRAFT_1442642 [Coprinopsis sp. MPI-PUGE-AT-0042]
MPVCTIDIGQSTRQPRLHTNADRYLTTSSQQSLAISRRDPVKPSLDQKHWSTALHAAAPGGQTAVVELLATGRFGVENAIDSDNDTAMKLAAKEGLEPFVRLLFDMPSIDKVDARYNQRTSWGRVQIRK